MKKALSLVLCCSVLLVCLTGCDKKLNLKLSNFEKYAVKDLQIEKKDISEKADNAYYDLDSMIEPDETENKRDHYAQVYSTAPGSTASSMAMIYTDYASADEAREFYDNITKQEEDMIDASSDNYIKDRGDNYLLVLEKENGTNWFYDCLYIDNDVILFVTIRIGTSDINNINKEWLHNVSKFFKDIGAKSPFSLSPEIDSLSK